MCDLKKTGLLIVAAWSCLGFAQLGCEAAGGTGSTQIVSAKAKEAYNQGVDLESRGNWRAALNAFLKAVTVQSNLGQAWVETGRCYFELRDYKHAEQCYTFASKQLTLPRESLRLCLQQLIHCEQQNGELELIQQTRREYVAKFPNAPDVKQVSDQIKYYDEDFASTRKSEGASSPANDIRFRAWQTESGLPRMPIKASISASKLMSPSKSYTKVVSDRYAALAKRAFLAWSSATDGTLIFDFVSNPADAQINCEWTNNLKERAHSFASGHCETILKGRSIWLAKQRALTYVGANLVASDMEFYNTCLHEIGHALGLNHSSHPEDVMYSGGRVTSAHAFAVLSKLDVYRVRKIYTYPFQSAQLALQYASAAFVDDDYDAAYKLLSETETKNKSLEQFQQALADQDHDPKPESLEIYRLYRDYHPGRITFILLARNHKTEQRYYFVQTVTMPDGVFRILDGGKISFKGSGVTQYDANRTSSGDERLVKHWEPE